MEKSKSVINLYLMYRNRLMEPENITSKQYIYMIVLNISYCQCSNV